MVDDMTTNATSASPRLYGIPAAEAPVVAVMRRGPTDWWHLGRWDTERDIFESGAWFRGALYPQKCDLSPDGRWLAYSALKVGPSWPAGSIYEAISRLPWLEALAAWEAGTTYTRGFHFDPSAPHESDLGDPDVGDAGPCLQRYGLRLNPVEQFSVERRRGWVESADTSPRDTGGPWDEHRSVEMVKPQPASGARHVLHVDGSYAGFRTFPEARTPTTYFATALDSEDVVVLDDVQWADWDRRGRLLVATHAGALEAREVDAGSMRTVFRHDLAELQPEPEAAPAWAGEW